MRSMVVPVLERIPAIHDVIALARFLADTISELVGFHKTKHVVRDISLIKVCFSSH